MNNSNNKYKWFNTFLTVLTVSLLSGIIYNINKYGSLSKEIFIVINLGFLIVALSIILLTVKLNNSPNRNFRIFYSVTLSLAMATSAFGFYLTSVVDSNVREITTESAKIEYTASFVVYNSNIKEVEQLNNKTMGIIQSEDFIEGNVLPKDELKKLKYENINFKNYSSNTNLINGLVKGEVDFISLPENYKTLYSTNEDVEMFLPRMKEVHTFSGKYDNVSKISGSDIDVTEVPFTVLLMGNDGERTDTLILASVNPKSMQVTLTSIARDSYVPIACYPNQNRDKINHARQISRDCTIKSVENLLDLSIDFFVEINFQGVVDLVDSLGTLTIDSPASFHGNIETGEGGGVFIPEGVSDLDGNQVLAFVRERYSFADGDFTRQRNQQQVIDVLLSTVIETRDVNKLVNLIKATGQNIETNLSLSQLIDLMNLGIVKMESSFLNNAELFTIYGNRISGRGALIYDPERNMELYYYILYNGSISDTKDFIAMNLRSDGILEIPEGFNYSYQDEYTPPIFSNEEYFETVDPDIDIADSDPYGPDDVEDDNQGDGDVFEQVRDIEIIDFSGRNAYEAIDFANNNQLYWNLVVSESIEVSDVNQVRNEIISNQAGTFMSAGDTLTITVREYYIKDEPLVEPEDTSPDGQNNSDDEPVDNDNDSAPNTGDSDNGDKPEV